MPQCSHCLLPCPGTGPPPDGDGSVFCCEGCRAVYRVLASMAEAKRTIVVMSHDPDIVKGPHTRLDLNMKPVPGIERLGQKQLPKPLERIEGPKDTSDGTKEDGA